MSHVHFWTTGDLYIIRWSYDIFTFYVMHACTFDCSLMHEISSVKLRRHGKTKKTMSCYYDTDDER